MTVQLIAEQHALVGAYRLTTQSNELAEALTTAELDSSVLGDLYELHEPGLKGYGCSLEGFWNPTEDAALFGYHRTRNVPVTFGLTTGAVGTPMRSVLAMIADHSVIEGAKGALAKVSLAFGAMDAPVLGKILHNAQASGNVTGAAVDMGAGPAGGQLVYGVLHVFSGSGNLDVLIQSATDSGFTTPNTRITFTQVPSGTPQAYQWATPVAVGDRFWRISATNPATRDFAVVVAIQ